MKDTTRPDPKDYAVCIDCNNVIKKADMYRLEQPADNQLFEAVIGFQCEDCTAKQYCQLDYI